MLVGMHLSCTLPIFDAYHHNDNPCRESDIVFIVTFGNIRLLLGSCRVCPFDVRCALIVLSNFRFLVCERHLVIAMRIEDPGSFNDSGEENQAECAKRRSQNHIK